MPAKKKVTRVKTSLAIDRDLWTLLRVQAVREHRPAYEILDDLLRAYLKAKGARS